MEISTDTVPVVINGLVKKPLVAPLDLTTTYEERIELPKDAQLRNLWAKLDLLGYLGPTFVSDRKGSRWTKMHVDHAFEPYEEVEVIADGTSVGVNEIRLNESLVAFTNRGFNLTFGLGSGSALLFDKQPVGAQSNELVIDNSLKIKFHRTVRMPDDGRMHHLPGSLGLFPLYNASAYLSRVPDTVRESGGVFMPIWSREALWMSFDSDTRNFALRVYVGRVNAVTGRTMDEDKILNQSLNTTQDYVVVPGQQWLDGIHVQEGAVRQFVAMPMGSGYTTEGQKTGQERYGGIQIEVIPEYQRNLRKWLPGNLSASAMTAILNGDSSYFLPETSTPAEFSLRPEETEVNLMATNVQERSSWGWRSMAIQDQLPIQMELKATSLSAHPHARYHSYSQSHSFSYPKSGIRRHSKTMESQSLGLAAGGKLIQDIYCDPHPPQTWNTAATRIINIHLLDPATCEGITHIVPPPPPIDTKDYVKSNLPFFVVEEQVDNRLEGGDFDNVKSVSTLDQEKGISTESTFDPYKPTRCNECKIRLCDCIVRPCDHTFCNSCIKKLEKDDESTEAGSVPNARPMSRMLPGFRLQ
ncbi:hypothetical protein DPV78_000617 [Talaromyces pinophilus]|nr:hypothetical protein DPV78_000617 [Talaromyces pinophilus]